MKYFLAVILIMGFLFSLCYGGEKPELKDQKDKESYSLGFQFGQSLKGQGVDINLEIYTSAIRDALGGSTPLMSQEEMRNAIMELQKRVAAAQQKDMKEKAEKNLSKGKAFLEENGKKEGVKTLPSGLQYKVLAEGAGKSPKADDEVTVNYRGSFIDGTEFDSSYKKGEPVTFKLSSVIPGWTEALQMMKEGSKWQLFIPPSLAYGEQAANPIPPNSVLVFEVELVSVKPVNGS